MIFLSVLDEMFLLFTKNILELHSCLTLLQTVTFTRKFKKTWKKCSICHARHTVGIAKNIKKYNMKIQKVAKLSLNATLNQNYRKVQTPS